MAEEQDPATTEGEVGRRRSGNSSTAKRASKAPTKRWRDHVAVKVLVIVALLGASALAAVAIFGGSSDDSSPPKSSSKDTGSDKPSGKAMTDDFRRPNSDTSLGSIPDGPAWDAISGTWGINDGAAYLVAPPKGAIRSIAVVDTKSFDGEITVVGEAIPAGWGVVFRMSGPFNFWILSAAPKAKSYSLSKVTGGKVVNLGAIGSAPLARGTTIKIVLRGPLTEFYADGALVHSVVDPNNQRGTKAGMTMLGEPAGARWGSFEAVPYDSKSSVATIPTDATTSAPKRAPSEPGN